MKKNPLKIVAILIGVAGAYLVYNYIKGKKSTDVVVPPSPKPTPTPKPSPAPPIPIPNPFDPKLKSPSETAGGNYIVKTVSTTGKLNVRSLPNSTSKVVSQIANGSVVKAQKSSVSGWYELLDATKSFPLVVGYVSALYLVAKV